MAFEPQCLCGIDHEKQREMAEIAKELARLTEGPMSDAFSRLSEILTPETLPPYDPNCVKCLNSNFIGNDPCDLHDPPPMKISKPRKKAKK